MAGALFDLFDWLKLYLLIGGLSINALKPVFRLDLFLLLLLFAQRLVFSRNYLAQLLIEYYHSFIASTKFLRTVTILWLQT